MAGEPNFDDLLVSSDPSAACLFVVDANENGINFSPNLPPIASSAKSSTTNGSKTIEVVINGVKRVITVPLMESCTLAAVTSTHSYSSAVTTTSVSQNPQDEVSFAAHRLATLTAGLTGSSFPSGGSVTTPSVTYQPSYTGLRSQTPRFGNNVPLSHSDLYNQFRPRVGRPVMSDFSSSKLSGSTSTSHLFPVASTSNSNGYGSLPATGFYHPLASSLASGGSVSNNGYANVLQNFTNQPWLAVNAGTSYRSFQLPQVQQTAGFQSYQILPQSMLQPQSHFPGLRSGFPIQCPPNSVNYQPQLAGGSLMLTGGVDPVSSMARNTNCNVGMQSYSTVNQQTCGKQSNNMPIGASVWPNGQSNHVVTNAPVGGPSNKSYPHLSAALEPAALREACATTVSNTTANARTVASGALPRYEMHIAGGQIVTSAAPPTVHHRPISTPKFSSHLGGGQMSSAQSSGPATVPVRSPRLYGFRFGEVQGTRHGSYSQHFRQPSPGVSTTLPAVSIAAPPRLQSRPETKTCSTMAADANSFNQFRISATTREESPRSTEAVPQSSESLIITVRTGHTAIAESQAESTSASCSNGHTGDVASGSHGYYANVVIETDSNSLRDVVDDLVLASCADLLQNPLSDFAGLQADETVDDMTRTDEPPGNNDVGSHPQPVVHSPEKAFEALRLAKSIGKGMHHVEKSTVREKVRRNRRKQCLTNLEYDDDDDFIEEDSSTNSSDSWHPDDLQSLSSEKTPSSAAVSEGDSSNDSWLSHDSMTFGRSRKSKRSTLADIRRTFFDTQSVRPKRKKLVTRRRSRRHPEAQAKQYDVLYSSIVTPCSVQLELLNMSGRRSVNVCVAEQLLCCSHRKPVRKAKRVIESDDDADTEVDGSDSVVSSRSRKRPRIDDSDSS